MDTCQKLLGWRPSLLSWRPVKSLVQKPVPTFDCSKCCLSQSSQPSLAGCEAFVPTRFVVLARSSFWETKRGSCLFQLCFKHSSLQQMAHQNSLKASESKSSGNSFTNKKNTAIYGSSSGPCMAPAKGGQKWLSVRECSTSEGSLNSEQIH